MIKFDRDEFLRPQIYSTKEEYQTRYKASNEIIKDIKELQGRIENATERLNALIEFWKKYNPIDNTMQVEQFKSVINILGGNNE